MCSSETCFALQAQEFREGKEAEEPAMKRLSPSRTSLAIFSSATRWSYVLNASVDMETLNIKCFPGDSKSRLYNRMAAVLLQAAKDDATETEFPVFPYEELTYKTLQATVDDRRERLSFACGAGKKWMISLLECCVKYLVRIFVRLRASL
jgi:hypothetical protein